MAGPFKIERKAYTIADENAPDITTAKSPIGKVKGQPTNLQTEFLATTKEDSTGGGNWIPVSIIMIMAFAAAGLANRKKKSKA
ncbi:MAG TPA: hypothetical protein DIU00_08125 [Phycisphaerales bacterium]|nr:hypothetical protein [Phycisphaerales bacterium]